MLAIEKKMIESSIKKIIAGNKRIRLTNCIPRYLSRSLSRQAQQNSDRYLYLTKVEILYLHGDACIEQTYIKFLEIENSLSKKISYKISNVNGEFLSFVFNQIKLGNYINLN